jgi:hypothetical protein
MVQGASHAGSKYPRSRVRDDMDDETWHRVRDEEERERRRCASEADGVGIVALSSFNRPLVYPKSVVA